MIEDRMSQQFAAMNMAMLSVIDSFEHLESASGNAIDITAMRHAQSELQRLESSFNQIESEIQQSERAQESFNRDIRTSDDIARKLLGTIGAIAGTYLSLQGLGSLINISDEMTNTTARIDLLVSEMPVIQQDLSQVQLPLTTDVDVNLKTDTAELADLSSSLSQIDRQIPIDVTVQGLSEVELAQQLIYESAQRSYSSFKDTADLVTRIGMNAGDAFSSTSEVIAFSELIQKQFGIAGASTIEASNATVQLSQALASGALRGDELNSIFEQAPNLIMSIADYLDVPIGAIREMAKEGQITADVVKNAMFAAADDINSKFDSMPVTWSQIWTTIQNDALMAFNGVLQYINSMANSENMKAFLADLKGMLHTLADVALWTMQLLGSIGSFIYENWSLISPVVYGVTGALVALGVAMAIVKVHAMLSAAWLGIQTLAMGLLTATSWANVTATLAATAATWGLNSALYANPIFWVIMLVIALIAVFYAAVAAINHFAGTSISATGAVAGAFMVALAFIGNLFVTLYNLVMDVIALMWNMFASFAEFLANVFVDPIGASMRLFADLADYVLGILQSLASAIDTIFGSNLASAVNGWRGTLDASITAKYGEAAVEIPKMDSQALHLDRFEYGKAFDVGYDWGSNLFDYESKIPEPITNNYADLADLATLPSLGEMANALDDLKDPGKETAKNTKKLADSATILEDDLKYLRDLSEREAINRYTTAEIKVDMKNENHINSEMDIDGVIDRFGEKVEEVVTVLAEGDSDDV